MNMKMPFWGKSRSKDKTTLKHRSLQEVLLGKRISAPVSAPTSACASPSSKNSGSVSSSVGRPRLTRARPLRYLSDKEVGVQPSHVLDMASASDGEYNSSPRSPSRSPPAPVTRTASAQPLPLPRDLIPSPLSPRPRSPPLSPRPRSPPLSPRPRSPPQPQLLRFLGSSDEDDDNDFDEASLPDNDGLRLRPGIDVNYKPSDNASASPPALDVAMPSKQNRLREGGYHINFNFPHGTAARSAPSTAISSPILSPRRLSSADNGPLVNHKNAFAAATSGSQNVAVDVSSQIADRIPLGSPRIRVPYQETRHSILPAHFLHPRSITEVLNTRHDMHPLPRPPGQVVPPVSPPSPPATVNCSGRCEGAVGRWQKGRLLGSGTFGTVYVGFNRESGDMCAMKEVPLIADDAKCAESIKQMEQEISHLRHLEHPNIVQYYGSESAEDCFYIYLEYVPGGSIHKLLAEYGPLQEPVIRLYTRQILSGLAYLHNMQTVHRDIKGANILVDTTGKVKLADFGMAKHYHSQQLNDWFLHHLDLGELAGATPVNFKTLKRINGPATPLSLKGSPYWIAPEILTEKSTGYDLSVDIWSLGCTVIEMATGKPPWSEYEGAAAMFKVFKKEVPPIPTTLSAEGRDFVSSCLCINPSERPAAVKLLEHPFVRNAVQVDTSVENGSHGYWENNTNTSDGSLASSHIHKELHATRHIGMSHRYSNPQLSPRSTLESSRSLSPPRLTAMTTNAGLLGNSANGFLTAFTNETSLNRPRSPNAMNIHGGTRYPLIRTSELSPRRHGFMPEFDRVNANIGEDIHGRLQDFPGLSNEIASQMSSRILESPIMHGRNFQTAT